jgi:nicotinate phosphoribosyltransferase
LAGFDGTSNTLAGVRYGIPVFGTMAHSFITSFRSEIDSFRAFADAFPEGCTLLIDTYDTIEGARRAIVVAGEMKRKGQRLTGVRLDSGDIADLARHVRAMLDEAGLRDVTIFVSGGMDEFEIQTLLSQGAPIDGFGVGTKVGVSADAPYGDCAYKMVAYDGRPVLKLSPGKQTLPGPKQVLRYYSTSGSFERDEITVADAPVTGDAEPLLAEVMRCGKVLEPEPTLQEVRRRFDATFARLPAAHKLLSGADVYPVSTSDPLRALSERLVQQTKAQQMMQD